MIEQDRLKQKLKVLRQHELPFKQVAYDILNLFIKNDITLDYTKFDKIVNELEISYLKKLKKLEEDVEPFKLKQQKLF